VSTLSRRQLVQSMGAVGLGLLSACGRLPGQVQPPTRISRIGVLYVAPAATSADRVEALRQGLREYGYIEGETMLIEYRHADAQPEQLGALAADLVQRSVDLIVTGGGLATQAAMDATRTLPIVMAWDLDAVGSGFVVSLARPGGNVTGVTSLAPATLRKGLELLKEILPSIARVAVLGTADTPGNTQALQELEAAARALMVQLRYLEIRDPADVEPAFHAAMGEQAEAILVQNGPALRTRRETIAELATRHRLPLIGFPEEGGLLSYGVSYADRDRRAAYYIDRILKGAKPADLPVEQPMTFDLVINLRTAQALGLTIPQHVLLQATEVIQ
jgi:putative tryptophan/tyrosine transport system substrate-binding protein